MEAELMFKSGHFFAVTHNGNVEKTYIDGELVEAI